MFKFLAGVLSLAFSFLTIVTTKCQDILIRPNQPVLSGEAPSIAVESNKVYISFASGDSIFYAYSTDTGKHFSAPSLVAILTGLVNVGGRGPQIVNGKNKLLIAAPDAQGDFHVWLGKKTKNEWTSGGRINDVPKTAKEGFVSIGATGDGSFFAVWLDLRSGKKNNLYGSRSIDGGKSWLKNQLVYKSPDGSVCECCKPSLATQGPFIAIMFRNNLNGNRDLYLIQSKDGGKTFDKAQKLGEGSWKLTGCPMDGGSLVIENNEIHTVWQREGNIYTCKPGNKETIVTKGRQCVIAGTGAGYTIAFINKGILYYRNAGGKITELGRANGYPKMVSLDKSTILCVWENEHKIYKALL